MALHENLHICGAIAAMVIQFHWRELRDGLKGQFFFCSCCQPFFCSFVSKVLQKELFEEPQKEL